MWKLYLAYQLACFLQITLGAVRMEIDFSLYESKRKSDKHVILFCFFFYGKYEDI